MIVDTAASITAIFEPLADVLDLDLSEGRMVTVLTAINRGTYPVSGVESLRVGDREHPDLPVIVLPDWDRNGAPSVVLGLDVLANYFLVFDMDRKVLELRDERPRPLPGRWIGTRLYERSPPRGDARLFFVRMRVLDRRIDALLDTGSNATILNWAGARLLGLTPRSFGLEESRLEDVLQTRLPLVAFRAPRLNVGRRTFRDQVVAVADLDIFEAVLDGEGPAGILGMNLLGEQSFAVDFKARQLLMRMR